MRTEELKAIILKQTEEFSRQFRGVRSVDAKTEKLNKILSGPIDSNSRRMLSKLVRELTGLKVDPSKETERARFFWMAAVVYIGNDISREMVGRVLLVSNTYSSGSEAALIGANNFSNSREAPHLDDIRPATEEEINQLIIDLPNVFETVVSVA